MTKRGLWTFPNPGPRLALFGDYTLPLFWVCLGDAWEAGDGTPVSRSFLRESPLQHFSLLLPPARLMKILHLNTEVCTTFIIMVIIIILEKGREESELGVSRPWYLISALEIIVPSVSVPSSREGGLG